MKNTISRRSFVRQATLAIAAAHMSPWVRLAGAADSNVIVDTSAGKIRGVVADDIKIFKGVPYGASTAGRNRFMPPVKPMPWTATRDVFAYGPTAPQAGADGATLFAALEKQAGLKLEQQKVATPVLVVDSVNQKPTDNPSGVALNLPTPPPAEFDVADIKLAPADGPTTTRILPSGQIDMQGVTLKRLMTLAWNITDDELIANMPKWYDTTR